MDFKIFANKVKDAALQEIAKWFANRYHLKRLGRITELRFDSTAQEIYVALDLHGEQASVEMTVHYRVIDPTLLEITTVNVSRPWMEEVINHMIPAEQKRVIITPAIAKVLSPTMQ